MGQKGVKGGIPGIDPSTALRMTAMVGSFKTAALRGFLDAG